MKIVKSNNYYVHVESENNEVENIGEIKVFFSNYNGFYTSVDFTECCGDNQIKCECFFNEVNISDMEIDIDSIEFQKECAKMLYYLYSLIGKEIKIDDLHVDVDDMYAFDELNKLRIIRIDIYEKTLNDVIEKIKSHKFDINAFESLFNSKSLA